ncbi:LysE family transporter [Halorarum halobium]|uniref:LysE family transporter n=1 Tax=Halorarum halobium TaxID=3075121 RepID=UPI0028AC2612|nr:LysE family transporter [Halobaculum sp. XH14]
MLSTLLTPAAGVLFGLALAAPPGPMNAVIAEESVVRGWSAGARAGLGAATADAVFLVLALVGVVGVVERFPMLRGLMIAVGGVLMLYYAVDAARSVRTSFLASEASEGEPIAAGSAGFRKAFVLALTNPYQVLFWLTVGVGLLEPGTVDVFAEAGVPALAGSVVVETGSPALLVGFFAGIGLWISGFPAALVAARRRVEALAPVVAGLSAVVLAGFGIAFLIDASGTVASLVG